MEATECYWDGLFDDEELQNISNYCESFEKETAVTGRLTNPNYSEDTRKSKISWIIRNDQCNWFFQRIEVAASKINSRYFGFDIFYPDVAQYTIYDGDGSHYDWHWDMQIGDELFGTEKRVQRKISLILQLSDPSEYEGGELLILKHGRSETSIEKKKGHIILFPSFLPHKVCPVTSGVRKSLVIWFNGPDWR
jgi:PKHD-type hydroxylase